MTERCENCRFWEHYRHRMGQFRGMCRRFPPTPIYTKRPPVPMLFPETQKDDWCGEFQPRKENESE